ncbi:hypothetical protein I6N96_08870 [Enterococcus sp. BWM-S5]|uniref:Uncharacterized protein n=1 Tax=Enterococcus larvae TaxID=2794352 RepID=A0ABS4CIE6_9ENTE|nr:hypothetical protein [Enterococcus larvae]MBP1046396.1 hypothetical protein [Enterococcus larvae]
MDKKIEITNKDWTDLTKTVSATEKQANANEERLNRHSKRLDALEDANVGLPLAIQQAVENGMSPVLEKVLNHDNKFASLEIEKERERAERAESELRATAERRQWMTRLIISGVIGVLITSIIGAMIAPYIRLLFQ